MEASHCVYLFLAALFAGLTGGQQTVQIRHGCHGVYYDTFGCFSHVYPFNNTPALPQNPQFVDTTFHLFTRRNPHNPQTLSTGSRDQDMGGSSLNAASPVTILIHGFLQNDRSPWVLEMTHTLLEHEDVSVITVDWGSGAGFPYTQAAANTRVAGAEVARLVSLLGEQKGVSARTVHLIGHSLGAHVAGHAGRRLRGSVGRITGLDPADPNFSYQPPEVRLDSTDALFVDVIHTDGGPYTTYSGYGTLQAMGHIDFYPNGGKNQPGCHTDTSVYSFVRDAYDTGMTNAEYAMACSHDRSILLFIQSIGSSCPFTAYPCSSEDDLKAGRCSVCGFRGCPSMGYESQHTRNTGSFFLETLPRAPFCGYHYLVKVTLAEDTPSISGSLFVRITGSTGHTGHVPLYSGQLSPGQVISDVVLSPENLGHVTGLTLTFAPQHTYFSWFLSTDSVHVTSAVGQKISKRKTYFCPESQLLQTGRPLMMTAGTPAPGPCFQH